MEHNETQGRASSPPKNGNTVFYGTKFQADLLQTPVVQPTVLETTALGAAYLAGLASGFWTSVDEQSRHWQVARTYEPVMSASQAGDLRERWSQAVKRSLQWASPDGS